MKYAFIFGAFCLWANVADAAAVNCSAPTTTVEINRCKADEMQQAEAKLVTYLQASLERNAGNPTVVERINASQVAWEVYRDAHCSAVYEAWSGGSIRGVMYGECKLQLTRQRTYELWQSWLTYGDAATPDLPNPSTPTAGFKLNLTDDQLATVGQKIFQNECAAKQACLVHWNKGEAFPSLGIGHFIWYPNGVQDRFVESFPELIAFMQAQSAELPEWLAQLDPLDAPWPNREAFLAERDSARVDALRQFLGQTKELQAEFMFERAKDSMERVVEAAPEAEQAILRQRLTELTTTPGGVYALIDYVNFKGEGLSPTERYDGEGWGLLQVLQQMGEVDDDAALDQFRQAAAAVLTRRAENAPRSIEKEQWLPGWLKRVDSYRD